MIQPTYVVKPINYQIISIYHFIKKKTPQSKSLTFAESRTYARKSVTGDDLPLVFGKMRCDASGANLIVARVFLRGYSSITNKGFLTETKFKY